MRLYSPEAAVNFQPSNPGPPAPTAALSFCPVVGDRTRWPTMGCEGSCEPRSLLGTFTLKTVHQNSNSISQKPNPYLTGKDKNHWFKGMTQI